MAAEIEEQAENMRFQYAVKILCTANIPGTSQSTSSLLPGVYQTVVNIHNPNPERVVFRKKIATTTPPEISEFFRDRLRPDGAVKIDCEELSQGFGIQFIHGVEGFLVIESPLSLDVVAVYTAGGREGGVQSIDVEHVPERRLG